MAIECGTIAITGTGSYEVNLSGAFQPNLLLFSMNLRSADGTQNNAAYAFGATDGTTQECVCMSGDQSNDPTNTTHYHSSSKLIYLMREATIVDLVGTLTSFDTDGFTINISTYNFARSIQYCAMLLDNAAVLGSQSFPASTGTQAYTGAGFTPTGLILASVRASAVDTSEDHANMMIGLASGTGATEECSISTFDEDNVGDTNTKRHVDTGACYATLDSSGIAEEATLSSLDSDGFTLNVSNAGASKFFAVCLGGGTKVKNTESLNSGTGTQAFTGAGFTPEAVLAISVGDATIDTVTDTMLASVGMASGASASGAKGYFGTDAYAKGGQYQLWYDATAIYQKRNVSGTVQYEMDISSLDSDGWTGNVTTAEASNTLGWMAIATSAPGGGGSTAWRGGLTLLGVG